MVLDASPKGRASRAALAVQDAIGEIVARLFQANLWRGALRHDPGAARGRATS